MGSKDKYKSNSSNNIIGILLIVILAVIPMLVVMAYLPVSKYEFNVTRTTEYVADVFSYYKSISICVVSAIIVILLVMDILTGTREIKINFKNPIIILSIVYIVMAVLSSIFSKYGEIALKGISERYEGIFVLIAYIAIFLVAMYYSNNEKNLKFIVAGLFLSAAFIGIVGFFQYIDKDPFATEAVKKIMLGKYYGKLENFTIVFKDVYATLYNPNCVGMYTSMMFPFMFVLTLMLPLKSYFKYIAGVLSILMFICLIGSDSTGGLIGVIASFGILILVAIAYFFYNKKYKSISKNYIFAVVAFIVVVVAFIGLNNGLKTKLYSGINVILNPVAAESPYAFKDMIINENSVELYTANGKITIKQNTEGNSIELLDYNNNIAVPVSEADSGDENTGKILSFNFDSIGELKAQIVQDYVLLNGGGATFMFKVVDGKFEPLDKGMNPIDLSTEVDSFGFEGKELLGTGRGYIWSRSIPLLKNTVILGKGPDTFALVFPQTDIIGKIRYLGNPYIVVDKPHNYYLQTGINTGIVSLIALLGIFLLYIFQSIKGIIKGENNSSFTFCIKIAVLGAVVGYLFSALSTDSVVSVAPIFWVILGTGFAVNKL